jgi:hypothetical protein
LLLKAVRADGIHGASARAAGLDSEDAVEGTISDRGREQENKSNRDHQPMQNTASGECRSKGDAQENDCGKHANAAINGSHISFHVMLLDGNPRKQTVA